MRVITATYGNHDDGDDVIVVMTDAGKELGAYCIVEAPEKERAQFEEMMRAAIADELAKVTCVTCMKRAKEGLGR